MAKVRIFFVTLYAPYWQSEERPALVTLKKGLVALARQWMKFIVVTQGFKAIRVMRSTHVPETAPEDPACPAPDPGGGARPQSDTSGDGADLEFDAGWEPVSCIVSFIVGGWSL